MPIKIPTTLPASKILESENIFVMDEQRAALQDIRPLKIIILNLMPTKVETETQLLRMLGNSPLQVDIELLQTSTYTSKNTSREHLFSFYKTFDQIKENKYDGMIITGAPIELKDFEDVDYWPELCHIMEWSKTNVFSTFHICWGAQAGLYYHYGVPKYTLHKKLFGVFAHVTHHQNHRLLRGFDEQLWAPHSRHTDVLQAEVEKVEGLSILCTSPQAGVYIVAADNGRQFFVTGHSEYDRDTLAKEYFRDVNKGLDIELPVGYFPQDDPKNQPLFTWRAHGNLLYNNWLNYFVYQETPYDLEHSNLKI